MLHRRTLTAVVLTVLATASLPLVASSAAAVPVVQGATTISPAPDYATEVLGDPWDYDQPSDILLDRNDFGPGPMNGVQNQRVEGGQLKWDANERWRISPLWVTHPGDLPASADGPNNAIDAARYTHATFRMKVDTTQSVLFGWFGCRNWDQNTLAGGSKRCEGAHAFWADAPGWRTYTFPISNTFASADPGLGQAWAGLIVGLHFDSNSPNGGHAIDWIRLHADTPDTTISYSGNTLYWDRDTNRANNTADNPNWGTAGTGSGSTGFNAAAYPTGTYYFYSDQNAAGEYSAPFIIDPAPQPIILDPDVTGGEDYATAVLGNPWDMSGPEDVAAIGNANNVSYGSSTLQATNTSNDPYVSLRLDGAGIDPDRYHRLTVTYTYDGAYDLRDAVGGGTHGRVVWQRAATGPSADFDSKEMVTFTDRPTSTWDLRTTPPTEVHDHDQPQPSEPGWTDGAVSSFRWDPNEDRGARTWRLHNVKLAADDAAVSSFDIRWRDPNHRAGTDVTFFADRDRVGFNGAAISPVLTQVAGENTFTWDTRDAYPGSYWIHATSGNGTSTSRAYASGPVVVEPRVRGAGRVETAIALSTNAFPSGADIAVVAYDGNYPDALAAAPLSAAAGGGPVLLNSKDNLHPAVDAELRRLGVSTVYLMGGSGVQSDAVQASIEAIPGVTVERVAGNSRYATAAAAARRAVTLWKDAGVTTAGDHVLIALGTNFPDALAAGSLAIHAKRPLLLIAKDSVPGDTNDALDDFATSTVTVIGGTGAIPDSTKDQLHATNRERIGGTSRFETGVNVARAAVAAGGNPDVLLVATGDNFPDALGAAPAVGERGGILLLTSKTSLSAATETFLRERIGTLGFLRVVGGPGAVGNNVVDAILAVYGFPR